MAKNNKTVKRGVYLYLDGKEIKNDINSIDLEIKRLQRDIKDMTRGSEEYNRTMAKIQNLQGILKQHRQEIKGITTETKKATISVGSMVDWFNRFGGVILSVIGFLTGFTLALRAIRDERNKLEESQAGLKALTGLDDENIAWLTEQAKTLSTTMTKEGLRVRQSAAEILDAFMLVGSAKPELLGDKEALKQVTEEAMRLQAAAKDITLNEAVDSLTLSLNQYGAAADQASRFTNVLAAGSKEGAVNIASQAKAIQKAGTIAATSNIPIEELVGTIEMLGEKGVKDEVAGTGLKTFFTRLATGATDTNPKVVGLTTALDNLNKKVAVAEAQKVGGGTSLMKKLFGDEGMQTAMILSQNVEQVKKYTAAVTDTNVAYEQAAVNSDTAQARLEQARNKMKLAAIDLGEKLNPALAVSTNMLTNVIKILPGLIDWCRKWGGTVVTLLIPLTTYYATLRLIALHHTSYNKVMRAGIIIKAAYRMATIALNDALAGDYKAITRLILQMRTHNIITRTVAAGTLVLRAAMEALTLRFSAAAKAIRAAWAVLGLNPIAAITTAIAAAVVASYKLTQRTKEYYNLNKVNEKITRKSNDEYERQSSLIEQLTTKIHNNSLSNDERRKAIEKLRAIIPEYHAEINEEGKIINENTGAIDRYNSMLATNIELKEVAAELDKHRINLMRLQKSPALNDNSLMGASAREDVRNKITKEEEIVASLTDRYKKLVQEKWRALNPNPKNNPTGTNGGSDGSGGSESEEERKKRVSKELEKVETESLEAQKKLKEQYLSNDKMTQAEYLQFLSDLEMKYLNKKLEIAGLEPKKREEIMNQILALQLKLKEQCIKEDLDEKKQFLSNQQKALNAELAEESQRYRLGISSREEYLRAILKLLKKYKKDILKITEDATGEEKEAVDSYIDYVMKALQKAFDQTEEKNKTWQEKVRENWNEINKWSEVSTEQQSAVLVSLLTDIFNFRDESLNAFETVEQKYEATFMLMSGIAQEFGVALGKTLAGEEEAMDEFMQNLVTMVLDTIQKMLIAYIAWTTIRNIGEGGVFIGLAKAAAEIALITAAFETAKSALGNFYTGGYTGPGNWDQPQGIVHSNEFVANRFAVANPNLRPIFDVIDVAQRTGNVGNLTAEDIAAVAGSGKNTHTVPAKAPGASATTTTNDPAIVAMLIECTRALRKLKSRLDDPLVAETYVTGKRGINQAQREYKKLENNKSRNKQ